MPDVTTQLQALRSRPPYAAAKVPEITVVFWVIKVLTTGMGEAASDWLGNLPPVLAVLGGLLAIAALGLALRLQLRAQRYHPVRYWSTVAMVAVFGTMAADVVHVATGLSYYVTSAFYALVVAALFTLWRRAEGTLSIHSIVTPSRELFYWCTVLATFALGTAVGDLVGLTMHLGFLAAGLLFLALMLVPLVGWRLGWSEVAAFWTAYVLTRPLGASFADWLGKEHATGGGLGYGDGPVTLGCLGVFAALIGWLVVTGHGVQLPGRSPVRPEPETELEVA